MEKKNDKKILSKILIIISAIIFIVALSIYIYNKIEEGKYEEEIIDNNIEDIINEDESNRVNPINFENLQSKNQEIYAWISVPQLEISYPVAQSQEDNYYLNRNIYGEHSRLGTIYTNKVNNKDFNDFNTVIYGHNVVDRAGNMFANLHELSKRDAFDSIKYVYIYTPEKMLTYEIDMVVRYYKAVYIPDEFPQVTDADKERFLNEMRNATVYDYGKLRDGAVMTSQDKYITLSTCMMPDDTRLLVIARLVETYEWK